MLWLTAQHLALSQVGEHEVEQSAPDNHGSFKSLSKLEMLALGQASMSVNGGHWYGVFRMLTKAVLAERIVEWDYVAGMGGFQSCAGVMDTAGNACTAAIVDPMPQLFPDGQKSLLLAKHPAEASNSRLAAGAIDDTSEGDAEAVAVQQVPRL
eukprot:5926873-Amphidinium_carterae.1